MCGALSIAVVLVRPTSEGDNMHRYTIALVITLTSAASIAAPDKSKRDAAKTGSEFGYFVGTWKCKEAWSKSPFSEAYETTSTLVATDDTDGVWMAWSYVQDPSEKNKNPIKGNDLWGHDPAKHTFLRVKVDNFAPGVIGHLTSKGFVDGTVTWEGPVRTPKGNVPFKHLFKKLDARTIEGRLLLADQVFYQSTCTKK
jgi:hypothetical protein